MAYNRKDYARIRAEYSEKYTRARREAELRLSELHTAIPEIREIDAVLSRTGIEIMGIISSSSAEDAEKKIAELRMKNEGLLRERGAILAAKGYPEDYSDVHYECSKCSDSGFADTKMCDCMKKALVLAGYESSGLGRLIHTQSFDNFSFEYYGGADADMMKKAVAVLKHFADTFDGKSGRSYLFFGATGLGKTHISTAVAKTVIDRGFNVSYVTSVGMLSDFEDRRFGKGEDHVDLSQYYDSELLIIDDFGTEVVNQFTVSCVYDVINTRINNRRSTIINTNLTKKDIEDKYGERIASRLFGEYYPIRFLGTDIRYQKLRRKQK